MSGPLQRVRSIKELGAEWGSDMITVNCTSFKHFRWVGNCTHQAAPRRLFGPARCIVWEWHVQRHTDLREMPKKCALCTPKENPILNRDEVEGGEAVQQWCGMRGDTAFSIIERNSDDWNEAGEMMEAWLRANGGSVPNAIEFSRAAQAKNEANAA